MFNISRNFFALLGISLGAFMAFMDFTIVSAALPAIQTDLQLNLVQLEWVMNAFLLSYCVVMASMGRLADLKGRRLLVYVALVLFALGCLVSGCAHNWWTLIVGRTIQGIGEGTLLPASLALIAMLFPDAKGKAIGIWSGIAGIGLLIGQGFGGVIVSTLSWHWVFWVNVPLFLVALLLVHFYVVESRDPEATQLDIPGFILLTISVSALLIAVLQSAAWQWLSVKTIGLFALSIVSFLILIRVERQRTFPLIDFKLFGHTAFFLCALAQFIFVFFNCIALFLIPLYLHYIHQEPAYLVGLLMMPAPALMVITSPWAGRLLDKKGLIWPILLGLSCYAISAVIQLFFTAHTPVVLVLLAFVFMGAGWGIILGPTSAGAINALPAQNAGIATGVLWTIQVIGGAIGIAVAGILFHHEEQAKMLATFKHAYLLLSAKQQHFLATLLNNPQDIKKIASQFNLDNAGTVLDNYVSAFLSGYQSTMLLLLTLTLIGLLITFSLKNK